METTALHVCGMCSTVELHLQKTSFTEVWTNVSRAHFKTVSDKQPLYLPRRATWATFAATTARICSGSEFNMCCTILGLEECKK